MTASQQLCGMVVDEMYRWRNDNMRTPNRALICRASTKPKSMKPAQIQRCTCRPILIGGMSSIKCSTGQYLRGMIAQRHAMPTLGDSITAARRPQIRNLLEETSIGLSRGNVIHAFERMITSAVREFPILSTVTRFDIAE
jgi:intracellular multiplication protein IcmB